MVLVVVVADWVVRNVVQLFVVAPALPRLPLQVDDAARGENDPMIVGQDTRLDNRILDLRAQPNQAIFKIQVLIPHGYPGLSLLRPFTFARCVALVAAAVGRGRSLSRVSAGARLHGDP
jgi:aspartyl-tRNA synthetase